MIDAALIREHMQVVGSDARPMGQVDRVLDAGIALIRLGPGSGFRGRLIPVTWVESIEQDEVRLSITGAEAQAGW